jgi:hypothetical protein
MQQYSASPAAKGLGGREVVKLVGDPVDRSIVRTLRRVVGSIACAAILVQATLPARAQDPSPRSAGDFQTGWYVKVSGGASLPAVRSEGMNSVVAYADPAVDVLSFLEMARASGVQVYVEIDRAIVRAGDEAGIRNFVSLYETHPALEGWYLADEPSMNVDLGPLSAATAERLYQAIKAEDPVHPVAIAFSTDDDLNAYRNAFDIAMWDEYPARVGQPEYSNMDGWRNRLKQRAWQTTDKQGWIPIIQAFTTGTSGPSRYFRLPTNGEARYMTYTAVQSGATGIFFFARYKSTWTYLNTVVKPLTAELNRLGPALKAGYVLDIATVASGTPTVVATTYRDPASGRYSTIVINHGAQRLNATLSIPPSLGLTSAVLVGGDATPIGAGTLAVPLEPYEARTYDLS